MLTNKEIKKEVDILRNNDKINLEDYRKEMDEKMMKTFYMFKKKTKGKIIFKRYTKLSK